VARHWSRFYGNRAGPPGASAAEPTPAGVDGRHNFDLGADAAAAAHAAQ
jgi:hypothetical protein